MTPLQNAILQNNLQQASQILTASPSMVSEADDNLLPSLLAARYSSLEIVKYIVEYSRASLDEYDSLHRNMLYYATLSGDVQKCRYLVERGALSPLEADSELITPYEIAYRNFPDTVYPYYCSVIHTPYPDMYHNPIRTGFYPDPSVVRVDDDYYMVNSSFIFFPCIPISHSRDLIHWTIIGHAITNPDWAELSELEGGRGYWAPDISYDNGHFYITATYRYNDTGTVYRRQMVVSSSLPQGPYSKPVFIDEDGIDPSIYHENGRHWMLLNRGARIFELSSDCTKKISDATLLYYGSQKHAPEGPHLLKKDSWYYLFQAEGGTGSGHRITVARSKSLMGIYEPCPYNPIMRQTDEDAPIQRCGHGKPVMTPDGRWYMVYLCGRQICHSYSILGRETALDAITWTADGWPVVNHLNGPSALAPKPLPECMIHSAEESSFQKDIWPAGWMTPREPQPNAVTVQDRSVTLLSSPFPLHSLNSRNLFLHRQESFRFTAELQIQIPSLHGDQKAGVVCYYDENTYVFFYVSHDDQGYYCTAEEQIGNDTINHEHRAFDRIDNPLLFHIDTDGLSRTFTLYSQNGTVLHSQTLENVYYLCDEGISMGKRFTGAVFGTAACGTVPFYYTLTSIHVINHDH